MFSEQEPQPALAVQVFSEQEPQPALAVQVFSEQEREPALAVLPVWTLSWSLSVRLVLIYTVL